MPISIAKKVILIMRHIGINAHTNPFHLGHSASLMNGDNW
jgi:hypothetical protein